MSKIAHNMIKTKTSQASEIVLAGQLRGTSTRYCTEKRARCSLLSPVFFAAAAGTIVEGCYIGSDR